MRKLILYLIITVFVLLASSCDDDSGKSKIVNDEPENGVYGRMVVELDSTLAGTYMFDTAKANLGLLNYITLTNTQNKPIEVLLMSFGNQPTEYSGCFIRITKPPSYIYESTNSTIIIQVFSDSLIAGDFTGVLQDTLNHENEIRVNGVFNAPLQQ